MAPQVQYYTGQAPIGRNGQFYDASYYKDTLTLINAYPQAPQISTVSVSGATNDKTYTLSINGVPVSYLSDASATQQEIAEGLADAINGDYALSGIVVAEATTNALTITSRIMGASGAFTVSEADAQLSVAQTQAPATAAPVPFGRCMVRTADREGRIVNASDFAGAAAVLSFTAVNSTAYAIPVTIDGVTYSASYTSDASATETEIATGLAGAITGLGVGLTGSVVNTDQLQIEADDGVSFALGALGANITRESYTPNGRPADVFVALLTDSYDAYAMLEGGLPAGVAGYPPNANVNGLRRGRVIVPTEAAADIGDPVYVRVAADGSLSDIGVFSNTGGDGLVNLSALYPNISWHMPISESQAVLQLG